ncbi:hypothetical protein Ccrd_013454 [Cynara cardunculus var. scolymus]|uniref:Uncharacterized protein n=1 Tax=Cynara cardunculus var. scolymus TaxID=59895 RepID=A0A103YFK6_CYNCS|nr:hypothetical protein Ccrd_013454 [Cynara cardunculus var. scolymus]
MLFCCVGLAPLFLCNFYDLSPDLIYLQEQATVGLLFFWLCDSVSNVAVTCWNLFHLVLARYAFQTATGFLSGVQENLVMLCVSGYGDMWLFGLGMD